METTINLNDWNKEFARAYSSKLNEIAEIAKTKVKLMLNKPSLEDSVKSKIEDNVVTIYTDNKILTFLEKGTRPHKIRAKPGKMLAFRSQSSGVRKDGSKFSFGDTIFTKEVNHPGFEARPFFEIGIFLAKNEIQRLK